jgi:hypothetical protein
VEAAAASGGLIGAAVGDRSRQQSTLTETSFQVTIEGVLSEMGIYRQLPTLNAVTAG